MQYFADVWLLNIQQFFCVLNTLTSPNRLIPLRLDFQNLKQLFNTKSSLYIYIKHIWFG